MDNRQDITDDEMAARDNARLVDVEETQDIEVVGAHGATITTLTESGSDYCRHDPSVICGVDGVATEAEWRAALRQILDIRVANHVLDTWSILEETLGEDELCQRDPASIAAAVRSAVEEKVISEHLAGQGPEWRADALDSRTGGGQDGRVPCEGRVRRGPMNAEEIATALLRLEAAQDLHSLLDAALGAVRAVRDALNEQLETYEHLVSEAQVQALDDAGHALWRVGCDTADALSAKQDALRAGIVRAIATAGEK